MHCDICGADDHWTMDPSCPVLPSLHGKGEAAQSTTEPPDVSPRVASMPPLKRAKRASTIDLENVQDSFQHVVKAAAQENVQERFQPVVKAAAQTGIEPPSQRKQRAADLKKQLADMQSMLSELKAKKDNPTEKSPSVTFTPEKYRTDAVIVTPAKTALNLVSPSPSSQSTLGCESQDLRMGMDTQETPAAAISLEPPKKQKN